MQPFQNLLQKHLNHMIGLPSNTSCEIPLQQAQMPTLQGKFHLCIPFLTIARPQSQFPQDRSTYFPAAEQADRSWRYINLSQIYACRNWETEHNNSVLEITVSFLGIQKWEPDINIGYSPALHLQCSYIATFIKFRISAPSVI